MTEERRAAIKEKAVEWLFSQGTSTVLLVAILVAIGWLARHALTVEVPRHIAALHQIVIDVEKSHREEREERDKKFVEQQAKDRELLRELLNSRRTEN